MKTGYKTYQDFVISVCFLQEVSVSLGFLNIDGKEAFEKKGNARFFTVARRARARTDSGADA